MSNDMKTDYNEAPELEHPIAKPIEPTYDMLREIEYPRISEQIDMIWHAMNADESKRLEPFYTFIKKVKVKYPKPD